MIIVFQYDINLNKRQLSIIINRYKDKWVLYNSNLKQLWIKDKPKEININNREYGNYMYHDSKKSNREFILKNGLVPASELETPMGYENMLFSYDKNEIDEF